MNKILISENALTKWYLLGSIEFLATLKCLIIICCFLPAEFWQKYAEVSELTGHVRTSGNYGNNSRQPALPQTKCSEGCCISLGLDIFISNIRHEHWVFFYFFPPYNTWNFKHDENSKAIKTIKKGCCISVNRWESTIACWQA
jgi:hypothetical protein